jgi:putative SOS response-associated peptidase YedK
MCRRYVSPDAGSILRAFGLAGLDWEFSANFNSRPGQRVPAVRAAGKKAQGVLMRWGFPAAGAFNAGIETVATSADFQSSWKQGRRCIVPAMGFYDWHVNPNGSEQPYYIHADDQDVFGFAGLWTPSRTDANAVTECLSIITLPANALMTDVANSLPRMPAILSQANRETWLFADVDCAATALGAYADERLIAYPVSTRVDSPDNNDESLLEPLETDVD